MMIGSEPCSEYSSDSVQTDVGSRLGRLQLKMLRRRLKSDDTAKKRKVVKYRALFLFSPTRWHCCFGWVDFPAQTSKANPPCRDQSSSSRQTCTTMKQSRGSTLLRRGLYRFSGRSLTAASSLSPSPTTSRHTFSMSAVVAGLVGRRWRRRDTSGWDVISARLCWKSQEKRSH